MAKRSITNHRSKSLTVKVNQQNELVLNGKSRKNNNFAQTVSANPPCVIFWDDDSDQFVTLPILGEVPDSYEFVDIITRGD